jgi:hypothetical protein
MSRFSLRGDDPDHAANDLCSSGDRRRPPEVHPNCNEGPASGRAVGITAETARTPCAEVVARLQQQHAEAVEREEAHWRPGLTSPLRRERAARCICDRLSIAPALLNALGEFGADGRHLDRRQGRLPALVARPQKDLLDPLVVTEFQC